MLDSTERQKALRIRIIEKLGRKCCHCGFDDIRALQIDHVDGEGNKELKNGRGGGLKHYYRVLNDDTGKYQLLCANCNWIKRSEKKESGGWNQHKSRKERNLEELKELGEIIDNIKW